MCICGQKWQFKCHADPYDATYKTELCEGISARSELYEH